jgi:hypothetical protein
LETFFVFKVSYVLLPKNKKMQDKIVEKASELFLNLGFKSVTMDDIANEMGISKKTIYQHFGNKNELVEATTMYMFNVISCGIDDICFQEKNPIEELFEIKNFVLKLLKDEKTSPIFQLQKYFPETYQKLHGLEYCKMESCVKANLERGVKMGVYRNNLPVDFTTRIYYSGVHSLKNKEVFPDNIYNLRTLEGLYLEYHVRAIASVKGLEILDAILTKND